MAAEEFNLLLQEEELKNTSLCLMANKQVNQIIILINVYHYAFIYAKIFF